MGTAERHSPCGDASGRNYHRRGKYGPFLWITIMGQPGTPDASGHARQGGSGRPDPPGAADSLAEETGRDGILDDAAEAKLLEVANQPLRDVIIIVRDMGLRPEEVFGMRKEQ